MEMTILFFTLWLQMSAQTQIVKFPCPEGAPIGIVLGNNQTVDGSSLAGYPCPFSTKGRKVVNTTIDGVRYEWCQTRKGNTECKKAAERAADETDGKPPKSPLTTKHNHIEVGEFVEPVDVPAVQRRVQDKRDHVAVCVESFSHHVWRSDGSVTYVTQLPPGVPECGQTRPTGWITTYTCADKSRVLLTSEDGKKHCIEFK